MWLIVGRLVVLLLLVLLVVWIVNGLSDGRRRQAFLSTRDSRGRPMLPPHSRVSDDALHARANELRGAVERGYISRDDAIGSLIRFGGPALSREDAERLLGRREPGTR